MDLTLSHCTDALHLPVLQDAQDSPVVCCSPPLHPFFLARPWQVSSRSPQLYSSPAQARSQGLKRTTQRACGFRTPSPCYGVSATLPHTARSDRSKTPHLPNIPMVGSSRHRPPYIQPGPAVKHKHSKQQTYHTPCHAVLTSKYRKPDTSRSQPPRRRRFSGGAALASTWPCPPPSPRICMLPLLDPLPRSTGFTKTTKH